LRRGKMSGKKIPVSPEVYANLSERAKELGLTPDEYATQLVMEKTRSSKT